MENGTTASPVSPVTTEELHMVHTIFERLANNIVNASHMSNDLSSLRSELDSLRSEVNVVRERNRELDEQVASVRRERDEAVRQLEAYRSTMANDEDKMVSQDDEIKRLRSDLTQAGADLIDAKRDRDDAGFKNMELEEKLQVARNWISEISRLFQNTPNI